MKSLHLVILGGTGFTGPFQVNYALARGHKVTLFNRGKRPSPEWPGEVEQLHGDRETGDLKSLEGREWDVCIDNPTSVPHWVREQLYAKAQENSDVVGDPALCNGTIISRFSYAIDVNEWGFRDLRKEATIGTRGLPIIQEILRSDVWDQ